MPPVDRGRGLQIEVALSVSGDRQGSSVPERARTELHALKSSDRLLINKHGGRLVDHLVLAQDQETRTGETVSRRSISA